MSTRRIVYTRPDGGIAVLVPAPEFLAGSKTAALGIAAIMAKDVPDDATDAVECDAADLPSDRTFRNAWVRDLTPAAAAVLVDMGKARAEHMGRIRAARDENLRALDGPWMRSTGRGDTTEADRIETERQVLRDIPQTFDLTGAATGDELKALWPAECEGPL